MGWFQRGRRQAPEVPVDLMAVASLRDGLVVLLKALMAQRPEAQRGGFELLIRRLERDPPPLDLVPQLTRLVHRSSAERSAFAGAREAREYADMARNLVVALQHAALLDPALEAQIGALREQVPGAVGPADARRLALAAQDLDHLALTIRQRARDDRDAVDALITELDRTLAQVQPHPATGDTLRRAREYAAGLRDLLSDETSSAFDPLARVARDPLTQVFHRGTFDPVLAHLVRRARDTHTPLSLVLVNLDHFQIVNDNWGHPTGDQILVEVARCLQDLVRTGDVIARVGGDEFAILLPGAARPVAVSVAERFRHAIENLRIRIHDGRQLKITASVGTAMLRTHESPQKLYQRADRALVEAKGAGRNQTALAA